MGSENWTQKIFSSSVSLKIVDVDKLGFPICGGADRGEFLHVGPVYQSEINYNFGLSVITNKWVQHPPPGCSIQEGDIILETDGWSVVGLRRREYLGLIEESPYITCCLKCVRPGDLPVSLRDYLEVDYPPGNANYDLQNKIRQNLLKVSRPVTTRLPREGEIEGIDYSFVTAERLFQMERDDCLLQFKEYDGHYYGIQKPDLNDHMVSKAVIKEFKRHTAIKRTDSFVKVFGFSPDNSLEDSLEKGSSPSPPRNGVFQRKAGRI